MIGRVVGGRDVFEVRLRYSDVTWKLCTVSGGGGFIHDSMDDYRKADTWFHCTVREERLAGEAGEGTGEVKVVSPSSVKGRCTIFERGGNW